MTSRSASANGVSLNAWSMAVNAFIRLPARHSLVRELPDRM
jgi:hypothetical protein